MPSRQGDTTFGWARKLGDHAAAAGLAVSRVLTLTDQELSFSGPARPDVLDAWRARFDRMVLLRNSCGASFVEVQDEFLGCLTRPDHTATAKVCCCLARKEGVQV